MRKTRTEGRPKQCTGFVPLVLLLITVASLVTADWAAAQAQTGTQASEADAVYRNAFVYTVDSVRSRALAFAVRDWKFCKSAPRMR
jgi:hypothetical protein